MIQIGLTGFTDHPDLLGRQGGLPVYAQTFPIVEVDSTAYGIPKRSVVRNWQTQVPPTFQFILKATRVMTRHQSVDRATLIQEVALFCDSLAPLVESGQLAGMLMQMPPHFGASAANVRYLTGMRQLMPNLPLLIEFRNPSWFTPDMKQTTLDLMTEARLTNVAVDEPQTPGNSIPFIPQLTTGDTLYVRLHGRNRAGWLSGQREQRTRYRYSDDELTEIATACAGQAENVCYIFNNNADHDAARDALRLQEILGVTFTGLAPKQMSLF